jgi:hypothetical protein
MPTTIGATSQSDSAWRAALFAFAATRIPILIVGYLAVRIVGIRPPPVENAVWRVYESELWNLPARWDAYWYYSIATEGYRWSGNALQQQSVVFFPFYPWLMRLGGAIAGGQPLIAGVVISLTAFSLALLYLYRLARLDVPPDQARAVLLLLTFYPFSIFYGAPYTESVFLLETVAAFYYLRKGDPVKAGLAGLLAGLTRPNGCVLAAPLMCLALGLNGAWREGLRLPRRWPQGLIIAAVMPIVGVLLYSLYLNAHFGHPFIWVKNQAAWGLTFLPQPPVEKDVGPHLTTPYASATVLVGNIGALILAAWSLLPLLRRFGIAYALFVVAYIAPAFLTRAFTSAGRFTSVLFPIFLMLASEIAPARRGRWIAAFGIGQVVAAALFYTWRPLV